MARVRRVSSNTAIRVDHILALLRRRSTNPPKLDTVAETPPAEDDKKT